jgi:TRAP-type C4-dicarboxylate transport system permease small subunit
LRRLLATLCGVLAAGALFAIMGLTLVDVAGRKLASASVPGSLEVTELLLVVVIFAGLPLVSLQGEHVVFDSLDPWLPAWLRRVQQVLVDLACAGALGGIAWLMWAKAGQMAEYGDVTAQLKLALPPFVRVMSVLCAATALVHLVLVFERGRHGRDGADESAPA